MIQTIKLAFYVGSGDRKLFRAIIPLIRFWDKSLITHVELVFEDEDLNYHWVSSRPGGVYDNVNYQYDPSEWVFVSLPPLPKDQRDRIENFIKDEVLGSGYDWFGVIFSAAIPIRFESKENWFCSELVRACLRVGGVNIDRTIPDHSVTPAQLFAEVTRLQVVRIYYPDQL